MANEDKRIKAIFELDQTGFNSGLKGINSGLRNVDAQMKLASQGLKTFGNDSTKLKSVQEALGKQVELQAKKVDVYRKAMENADKKMQENIKNRDKLKTSLDQANKKYEEAVKVYGKESVEAKKAKEEVDRLSQEHKKASQAVETNAKSIQNNDTNMKKAQATMQKTEAELKRIEAEIARNENKWNKLSQQLQKTSEKFKKVGGAMQSAGEGILKAFAPLGAAMVAGTKASVDFAGGMAKVSTIADTTKVPLSELRKGALGLSKDFGVGAKEITESMYQAISASVPTEKAIGFVSTATKSATAGFTDATTAVDGLTTVMNSYGMQTEEAEKIANQMLITQNEGKTTFGLLAQSMGQVTPISAQLNIKTEELFSSLAATTAQGLDTSESVTALKASMSNIIKPSEEASKAAEQLGIDFSVSALKSKGWMGFLQDVKKGLANASPEFDRLSKQMTENANKMLELENAGQKGSAQYKELTKSQKMLTGTLESMGQAADSPIGAMAQMFGSVKGLNSILMLTSEQGTQKYNKSMKEMETNTTALDDAFKKMEESPGEKWKKAVNEMKIAGIKLGDSLMPVFEKITSVIGKMGDAFSKMSPAQMKFISSVGLAGIAVGGFLKIGGKVVSGVGTFLGILGKISGGIGTATLATQAAGTATAGVATAGAGASASVSAMGLAAKGAALLMNPWVLGIGAATIAGVALYKHLQKEATPSVDLFADKMKTSSSEMQNYGKASKGVQTANIKISESTKKAVGGYMDLDKKAMGAITKLYVNGTKITKQTAKNITDTYAQMGTKIKTGFDKDYKIREKQMKDFFTKSKNITKQEQQQMMEGLKTHNTKQKTEITKYENQIKAIMDKVSKEKRAITKQEQQTINQIQDKMKQKAVKSLSASEIEQKVIMERLKSYNGRITAEQASETIKNAESQRQGAISKANSQYDGTVKSIIRMRDETGTITAKQADKMIKEAERQRKESIDKADNQKTEVVKKITNMNGDIEKSVDTSSGKILTFWDKMKTWWTNWKPDPKSFEANLNLRNASGIDKKWTGDNFYKGGVTALHDTPGQNSNYELYDLPRGTRIFNHDASADLVTQTAENVATKVANSVLSSFSAGNNNNSSQTIIVPVTLDGREIAKVTAKPMSKELAKLNKRGL